MRGCRESPVSLRTRLPARRAPWNSRLVTGPLVRSDRASSYARLHLALDLRLARDHRLEPGRHAEQVPRGVDSRASCGPLRRAPPAPHTGAAGQRRRRGLLSVADVFAARYSSVRLQVDSATASSTSGGRPAIPAARPPARSVSSTRSRSASGAVLCDTPTATSVTVAGRLRGRQVTIAVRPPHAAPRSRA